VATIKESRRAVGFAVAPDVVVTSAASVAGAGRVHIDVANGMSYDATVLRTDAKLGLALLRVSGADLSCLTLGSTVKAGPIRCGGFPTAAVFSDSAKLMSGTVDAEPADGKPWTVKLSDPPRLPGGPLLAADGSVVGVELGDNKSADDVPAVPAAAVRQFVADDAHPTDVATDPRKAVVQVVADPE
jgi:S1-C subfamily serine protease